MTPPAIEARGLSKAYGTGAARFDALTDISLTVDRGESVAIVGKSGSGKSTLMHLLALLDRPDSGTLAVNGVESAALRPRELNALRNREFGFVFQQFFLNGSQTVLENVTLPLVIAGVGARERRRRGMEVLTRLELEHKAGAKATALSGGQKQRAVIARALVGAPSVIFADEPTGNLDSNTGAVVEDLLFSLNQEQGITLVVVTHDEDLAERCGRQITVRDGRLVTELDLAGVAR
ncbi:ABC transporter ATP-binding protein [Salinibacterium sp. ZJ450]|uniref:ABC transporter ATP-binding protein n=1 Tax=Salinibacterium sp. ZJ450 TaxID=2708338 RepID=UPI00141F4B64|nr:ABC transporter ATP-binding protein [Salinibacterium sp. ZJ450]